MELKSFIQMTLEHIVEGVEAANQTFASKNALVNPRRAISVEDGKRNEFDGSFPRMVDFDVALTRTGGAGSTEGVGVFLGPISLGKKNESTSEEMAVSRVKFTIPLVLPVAPER